LSEENIDRRYPVEETRYKQSVGKLLPHRLSQISRELGFETEIAKGQSNGVDIKIYQNRRLVLVGEVLNWSLESSLNIPRKNSIIDNFSRYTCKKVSIYTCLENESTLLDLARYEVDFIKIGYQLLPKSFYDFFTRKNQVTLREIDSRETRQDIKSKLIDYLQSIELLPIPL